VRLRRLKDEMGDDLQIQWKAFPLRPEPDPTVAFKGTYREEGWRRCGAMAASDGITYAPWPRDDYPNWSLPALEAAKCVALQGPEAFDRLHLRLYEAFFSRSINIAKPEELLGVVKDTGVDMARFVADWESGVAREAVARDYEEALTRDRVRAIPTIIVEGGRRLTGLVDLPTYRKAIEDI
jgi:predicted DsbA family dithiol-disulfide isomerase